MIPFAQIQHDVRRDQIYREVLLSQPLEYFDAYVGATPNQLERVRLVEQLIRHMDSLQVYENDVYRVEVRHVPPFIHLDITRFDGRPCNNWRDFQQIKNELIGPECEGVELYPAESRLVDTANQYHMWIAPNREYRFPFGYENRLVLEPVVYRPGGGTVAETPKRN